MGWTYQKRKWRDAIRQEYLETTGREHFDPDEFEAWAKAHPKHKAHFQDG